MYWGIGLPFACLLAFRMGLGAMGLWTGLACTASLQSLILSWIVFKFDWNAEAQRAKALIEAGDLEIELEEEVELMASSGRLGTESLLDAGPLKPTTLTL